MCITLPENTSHQHSHLAALLLRVANLFLQRQCLCVLMVLSVVHRWVRQAQGAARHQTYTAGENNHAGALTSSALLLARPQLQQQAPLGCLSLTVPSGGSLV